MKMFSCLLAVGAFAAGTTQLSAQDTSSAPDSYEGTVFDGDHVTIGAGAIYGPSYRGSDDYVVSPFPVIRGSIGGITFNPRAGGVAVDFIPDADGEVAFSAGIAAKLNRNRASQIEDEVVKSYGELDTAIEVGPSVGVSFPGVLNPYDSLSFNVDAVWDVAGAHNGMSITPGVTYFTPVSRAAAVALAVSATHIDDDYADYYYSVAPGGPLAPYQADGGFESVGVNLLGGIDLDGNLANGGLAAVVMGGYSRMLGDAKRTPFTSVRGDGDQWVGAVGLAYTF